MFPSGNSLLVVFNLLILCFPCLPPLQWSVVQGLKGAQLCQDMLWAQTPSISISALWLKLLKTLALLERLVLEVSSHPLCPGALYPPCWCLPHLQVALLWQIKQSHGPIFILCSVCLPSSLVLLLVWECQPAEVAGSFLLSPLNQLWATENPQCHQQRGGDAKGKTEMLVEKLI